MLRISAHFRLYCSRNLAAVRTSSSISSVRIPSLISDRGSARKVRAIAAIDAAANSSRRVVMVRLYRLRDKIGHAMKNAMKNAAILPLNLLTGAFGQAQHPL